jgi:hypothetical protein
MEKVDRYRYISLKVDCMFDRMLSMSFLHIGITNIYQMVHTFNNPKAAKACIGVLIYNCLVMLALYH